MPNKRKPAIQNNGINVLDWDKLVMKIALRFRAGQPVRDSWQYAEGWIGLIRASELFDPARGCKFTTYAMRAIKSQILKTYKANGCLNRAVNAKSIPFSQTAAGIDGAPDSDFAVSREQEPLLEASEKEETAIDNELLGDLMRHLDKRSQLVLTMRYFEEKTLDEIGVTVGITKERVRQVILNSISKLQRVAG